MTRIAITPFSGRKSLTDASQEYVHSRLQEGLATGAHASLLCAGGSTPRPLYEALSNVPLDWGHVTVGLTDERWVPHTAQGSNEAFLRSTLMSPGTRAAAARFLPMFTHTQSDAFDQASHIDAFYKGIATHPDCVIVGMGADAHTLSWFANARGLDHALDPANTSTVAALEAVQSDVTGDLVTRISLTFSVIAHARSVLLLITGDDKRTVYETASEDSPIAALCKAADSRLKVHWSP